MKRPSVRLLFTVAMFLMAFALPVPALAGTHWLCGLSSELVQLVCVVDTDIGGAEPVLPDKLTAVVHGARFPLDPRQTYVVNMWSAPNDLERVELLARATICFRSPDCQVNFSAPAVAAAMAAYVPPPLRQVR